MSHSLLKSKFYTLSLLVLSVTSQVIPKTLTQKESTKKLSSSILFPEIHKELQQLPPISTVGLFIVQVLKNKVVREEWYV